MDLPWNLWRTGMTVAEAYRMPRSSTLADGRPAVMVDGDAYPVAVEPEAGDASATVSCAPTPSPTIEPGVPGHLSSLDQERIWAEVVFTAVARWVYKISDADLLVRACRTLNRWLATEVQQASDGRLIPAGLIPVLDPRAAVAEVESLAAEGLLVAQLPLSVAWNEPEWDPLWAALQSCDVIAAYHAAEDDESVRTTGRGRGVANYVGTAHAGQRVASRLAASGVLDAHPGLRVLLAECGAGWVPHVADRLDEGYTTQGSVVDVELKRSPGIALREQVWTTLQHEPSAPLVCDAAGYHNVIFGRDYPHHEGTWGHTLDLLTAMRATAGDAVAHRITVDAFAELLPRAAPVPG